VPVKRKMEGSGQTGDHRRDKKRWGSGCDDTQSRPSEYAGGAQEGRPRRRGTKALSLAMKERRVARKKGGYNGKVA